MFKKKTKNKTKKKMSDEKTSIFSNNLGKIKQLEDENSSLVDKIKDKQLLLEKVEKMSTNELTLERFEKLEFTVKEHSKLIIQLTESNRILIESNENQKTEKITLRDFELLELNVQADSDLICGLTGSINKLIESNENQNNVISKYNIVLNDFLLKLELQIELIEKNQIMTDENKKKLISHTLVYTKLSSNIQDYQHLVDRLSGNIDELILKWNDNLSVKLEKAKKKSHIKLNK